MSLTECIWRQASRSNDTAQTSKHLVDDDPRTCSDMHARQTAAISLVLRCANRSYSETTGDSTSARVLRTVPRQCRSLASPVLQAKALDEKDYNIMRASLCASHGGIASLLAADREKHATLPAKVPTPPRSKTMRAPPYTPRPYQHAHPQSPFFPWETNFISTYLATQAPGPRAKGQPRPLPRDDAHRASYMQHSVAQPR